LWQLAIKPLLALISDVHANLEALEATLRDIDAQGVSDVVCLGDVVGYGAQPFAVVNIIRQRCGLCLLGNHDAALLDDQAAFGFNDRALAAIDFTRTALDPELEKNWAIWDWLGDLHAIQTLRYDGGEEMLLVHASPCEPLSEYLLPNADSRAGQLEANFEKSAQRLWFYGHTHHPGWFKQGEKFVRANALASELQLEDEARYLINVGSVGQPRDGDPRACYALFDGESIRWRRVEYDVEAARARIIETPELPNTLGDRLLAGR